MSPPRGKGLPLVGAPPPAPLGETFDPGARVASGCLDVAIAGVRDSGAAARFAGALVSALAESGAVGALVTAAGQAEKEESSEQTRFAPESTPGRLLAAGARVVVRRRVVASGDGERLVATARGLPAGPRVVLGAPYARLVRPHLLVLVTEGLSPSLFSPLARALAPHASALLADARPGFVGGLASSLRRRDPSARSS